jgi:hypothetical protein
MGQVKQLELEKAFDAALALVARLRAAGMETMDGESAGRDLENLERELRRARDNALQRGTLDREWFQKTVRWVITWAPDDELTLVAALGAIARATPSALS